MKKHASEHARTPRVASAIHAPTVGRRHDSSGHEAARPRLEPPRTGHSLERIRTHADTHASGTATLLRKKASEEKAPELTLALPDSEDLRLLAAIVYAEASANPVDPDEMRAIASVIRNRVAHVKAHPADKKWFGDASYLAVISKQTPRTDKETGEVVEDLQFRSYGGARYQRFLTGAFPSRAELRVAQAALEAATTVYTQGALAAFVFFQRGSTSPNKQRAEATPTKIGAHHFWAFRAEEQPPEKPRVERQALAGASTREVPSQVYEALDSSASRPLEPDVRQAMETRLGHDFSRVHIHTDASADSSARAVDAVAYTVGSHVAFREGTYQPGTPEGQRLLTHELVHVMQQAGGPELPRGEILLGEPSSAAEQQAHGLAQGHVTPMPEASGAVQRRLSYELADAPMVSPSTNLPVSEDEGRVLAWLRERLPIIIRAEQKYLVDRRAIAAAIAWEALENNWRPKWMASRGVGPGKPHYKETPFSSEEGMPITKEVEEAGYIPRRTMEERKQLLTTDEGSIEYIAAIMAAIVDAAAEYGYDLRRDPVILTTVYQGKTLRAWREHLSKKPRGEPMRQAGKMAAWTQQHLDFINEAVGAPELPEASFPAQLQRQTAAKVPDAPKPEAPPPEVDPGTVRAQAAERMVKKLQEVGQTGTKYKREVRIVQGKDGKTWEESTRDWENYAFSDCTKFVQWVLEGTNEGGLFGRENATTGAMLKVIDRLVKDGKSAGPRKGNPKVGDLIFWTGHVALVTELLGKANGQNIVFANMGGSGANLIGKGIYGGKVAYWLKVDELPKREGLAEGEFLGYWTP